MSARTSLAAMLLGVGVVLAVAASGAVPVDSLRRLSAPEPTPAAAYTPVAEPATVVAASPPVRLVIASAGIDVPIEVDATAPGGVVEPARFDRPYWLSAYGAPGTDAKNTVYLAGHSSVEGSAIFDLLLGADREPLDLTGQQVQLDTATGTVLYAITGPAVKVPKTELAGDAAVWEVSPGRLIVFTCNRNDRAFNVVFTAELIAAVPHADSG